MTLAELEALDTEVLTCAQVAPVLRCKPYSLHQTAMQRPQLLPFPVIVIGRRVMIPRDAFCSAMRGGKQ